MGKIAKTLLSILAVFSIHCKVPYFLGALFSKSKVTRSLTGRFLNQQQQRAALISSTQHRPLGCLTCLDVVFEWFRMCLFAFFWVWCSCSSICIRCLFSSVCCMSWEWFWRIRKIPGGLRPLRLARRFSTALLLPGAAQLESLGGRATLRTHYGAGEQRASSRTSPAVDFRWTVGDLMPVYSLVMHNIYI